MPGEYPAGHIYLSDRNGSVKILPNFFIVGAQKSATTSLHHYLAAHSEIYLPRQKETKFFVADDIFKKGIEYYRTAFFTQWNGEAAVGEIDPDYMYFEIALERMAEHIDLRQTKFIFILRNPADRAFSHYLMSCRRGIEPLSFEEAIEQEPLRISKSYEEKMHYSYISRGYYLRQIEVFLGKIDRSQMLFLLTEDLTRDPQSCLKEVFTFLSVTQNFRPPNMNTKFHPASIPRIMKIVHFVRQPYSAKRFIKRIFPWPKFWSDLGLRILALNSKTAQHIVLSDHTRQKLLEIYRSENQRLAAFLGRELVNWINDANLE